MVELVLAFSQMSDPQDDQLGLPSTQLPSGHQTTREAQPATEKVPLPPHRQEKVGWVGTRDPSDNDAYEPVDPTDIGTIAGRYPGLRHPDHRAAASLAEHPLHALSPRLCADCGASPGRRPAGAPSGR